MKTKKEIKYYNNEEIPNEVINIENRINKIINNINKINNNIDLLRSKPMSNRVANKLIKLSYKKITLEQRIIKVERELLLLKEGKLEKKSFVSKIVTGFSENSYSNQVKIWGIVFIIPWLIGMVLFFIPSVLTTIGWSFNTVDITQEGIFKTFTGFKNFQVLFGEFVSSNNTVFTAELIVFLKDLAIDLPIIIIFSIIIAVLLNKKFKGHVFVKAIFFIPVIYNVAVISSTLSGSFGQHIDDSLSNNISFVDQTVGFFMQIGIAESLVTFVVSSVDRIFTIVNLSGIQILIFIAAIQSIPGHLYEAAEVEGATKYESFWKITVPMITPMILTAAIFTVVDSFTRAPIFTFLATATAAGKYGLASAISVVYFIINIVIIGFVYLLFRGRVFYHDEK